MVEIIVGPHQRSREAAVDELTDFLRNKSFFDQKRQIEKVFNIIADVLPVFSRFWVEAAKAWPYELRAGERLSAPREFSASTNAMVTFALAVAVGRVRKSILLPALRRPSPLIKAFAITQLEQNRLQETLSQASNDLVERASHYSTKDGTTFLTRSGTYGDDDPFTLTWLSELIAHQDSNDERNKQAIKNLVDAAKRTLIRSRKKALFWSDPVSDGAEKS
jgi:hypothetical protein